MGIRRFMVSHGLSKAQYALTSQKTGRTVEHYTGGQSAGSYVVGAPAEGSRPGPMQFHNGYSGASVGRITRLAQNSSGIRGAMRQKFGGAPKLTTYSKAGDLEVCRHCGVEREGHVSKHEFQGTTDTKPFGKSKSIPGYREPWTGGAKAYPEADTLAALHQGTKRKRRSHTVLMPTNGEIGKHNCHGCGGRLDAPYAVNPGDKKTQRDTHAYVDVNPKAGTAVPRHYYCAWGDTMNQVAKLRLRD